ncbi:MAG: serine hydrolase domain-containing protein [Gemmatimonadaceae bacterium]
MKSVILGGLLAFSLGGCGSAVGAKGATVLAGGAFGVSAERGERAATFVDSLRAAHQVPAISAAVAINGRVVWEHASGWTDRAHVNPATPASVFRIGSLSKLLTATAAVRLWERGALDLDRSVRDLIPEVPVTNPPITARMLAGHLSGIRHYGRSEYVSRTAYPGVSTSLSTFLSDSLVAPPGTRYTYSSYGYNLLGSVIERAAKKEFRAVIRDEVTSPLQVEQIRPAHVPPAPDEVEYLSKDAQGSLTLAPHVDLSDRWPSGGYVGTAPALARFGSSVFSGFSESGRDLILTPMKDAAGKSTGVGFGWRLGVDSAGRRFAHHGGDAMGSRAYLLALAENGVAVAILSNVNFAPIGEAEARRVLELIIP